MDLISVPVSVIIVTFNRKETVCRAIDSALNQTLPPAEVIVVDDGSTDGTKELLEHLPGIRYVWQENQKQAAARNTGLSFCTGDIVATLDSDDWWDLDHLSRALRTMRANDVPVYCSNWREINCGGQLVREDGMSRMRAMPDYLNRADPDGFVVLNEAEARWLALMHQPAPSSAMVIDKQLICGWDSGMAGWIREDLLLLIEAVMANSKGMSLGAQPTWNKEVDGLSLTSTAKSTHLDDTWFRGEQHIYQRVRSLLRPKEDTNLRKMIAGLAFDQAYNVSRSNPARSVPLFWEAFRWTPSVWPLIALLKQLLRLLSLSQTD